MDENAAPKRWHAAADAASLRAPGSLLAIRMGMAANALTSARNFTRLVSEIPVGPVKQLLMLQSLQLAVSYLKESSILMADNWTSISAAVADAPEVTEDTARCEGLAKGTDPLCPMLQRVRSRLTFHWDAQEVKKWVRNYREPQVVWLQGESEHRDGLVYRASADVVAGRLLGSPPDESEEETERKLSQVLPDILDAMQAVHHVFDASIGSLLASQHCEVRVGDPVEKAGLAQSGSGEGS